MTLPSSLSTSPAAPVHFAARPRSRFGQGFWTVFRWGLRLTLKGRRFFLVVLVAGLLGAVMGGSVRDMKHRLDPALELWRMLDRDLLKYVVPLVALVLVAQGYSREVQDRTLLFHLVRPVSRSTVFLARFLSGLCSALVATTVLVATLLGFSGVSLEPMTWFQVLVAAFLGVMTVGSIYYALAALLRHGTILGLVYTFVIEVIFSSARGSMQNLTVMFHVRSLHHRWTDDAFLERVRDPEAIRASGAGARSLVLAAAERIPYDEPMNALLVLASITAVVLAFASWRVSRRDFALKD